MDEPLLSVAALAINTESSLDMLLIMADKIKEHTEPPIIAVINRLLTPASAISAISTPVHKSSLIESMHYDLLSKQLEKLTLEIDVHPPGAASTYKISIDYVLPSSFWGQSALLRITTFKTDVSAKLNPTSTMAGISVANRSNRLWIVDVDSTERFLVDSGTSKFVLDAKNKK